MIHAIDISTVDAIMILKGLHEEHFPSPTDKKKVVKLAEYIRQTVQRDLCEVEE